jgi:serine/threonine protein kinase
MELVDGKPLNELIPRKGMRLAEALRIAAQVAGALTTAHAAGIVHRDLKPANIMVDGHGRVKVLDFGLAKLSAPAAVFAAGEDQATVALDQPVTEEGMIIGSVPYMSPEQAEGKPVDARSDIFSFGAVLYEMITGQRAFRGESRASTLAAVVEKDPQAPSEVSAHHAARVGPADCALPAQRYQPAQPEHGGTSSWRWKNFGTSRNRGNWSGPPRWLTREGTAGCGQRWRSPPC